MTGFKIGERVKVVYNHPVKANFPVYTGELWTEQDNYIRIKRRDGSYRSFSRNRIVSVSRQSFLLRIKEKVLSWFGVGF